ncbi:MAG: serine O-acetyltransferase [Candidatus Omnitrophica bacterium]|nr:serine O-acetyltransferase [Candidatus Omnitrophota bacterium]
MKKIRDGFDSLRKIFSLSPNYSASGLYYLSRWFYLRKIPLMPFLFYRLNAFLNGCEIHYKADIGPGLEIIHSQAVIIGSRSKIGTGVRLYSSVVLGSRRPGEKPHPVIGDHVVICSGAKVLGGVHIGDYAVIGANAVVLDDVALGMTAVGNPAREVVAL